MVIIIGNKTHAYTGLGSLLSERGYYKESLKAWHQYIRQFLYIKISSNITFPNVASIPNVIFNFYQSSASFVTFSRGMKQIFHEEKVVPFSQCGQSSTNQEIYVEYSNVTRASGTLIQAKEYEADLPHMKITHLRVTLMKFCGSFSKVTWIIELDGSLGFNLTFHHIYFTSGSKDCCSGNLAVSNKNVHTGINCHRTDTFVFCGHNSIFNLYSKYNQIYIGKHVDKYVRYNMAVSYEVQDVNLVVSLKPPCSEHATTKSVYSFSNFGKETLMFILLQSRKAHYLVVKFSFKENNQDIKLCDGPGILSNEIHANRNTFTTSSF